jgi:hypothetical protein
MIRDASNRADSVSRASLPSAAQRWLDTVLPQHLDFPSGIRIEQEGSMEVRGRWTPFSAHGVYRASPLSFNWQARFRMLPGVWIVAEDGHSGGRGWGGARLWGVIPMGKRTDPEVLKTQLVRNLGELVWLPAFVLADSGLTWADAGECAFEVRSSVGDQEAIVRFEINDLGEVTRAYSPSRPYDVPGGYAEAPWYYEFSDHREFGGVRIPARAVATFEKSDGAWEYFRCRVTSVTF